MASILDRVRGASKYLPNAPGQAALYLRQLVRGNRGAPPASTGGSRSQPAEDSRGRPVPVLLLQGYLANRGSVHLLAHRLHERGHVVMTYRLGHLNLGDIRDTAGLVARKVESLIAQAPVDRVDIIGHSMGGLVGLYYVKRLGGRHRVRRLVMLGTPAEGTWTAVFGLLTAPLGAASRQLLPGSPFLRELREAPIPAGVEVTTIGGERDFFAPLGGAILEGARHLELPTTHSGFLVEEAVADTLDELLRAPSSGDESTAT